MITLIMITLSGNHNIINELKTNFSMTVVSFSMSFRSMIFVAIRQTKIQLRNSSWSLDEVHNWQVIKLTGPVNNQQLTIKRVQGPSESIHEPSQRVRGKG